MTYGRYPYGGVAYAGSDVAEIPQNDAEPILAVEIAFTTGALETPVWEPVTSDVRSWDVQRGRNRELERFQPGRATVVLDNRLRQYDSVAGLPAQYIDLPGASGNYASTPDSPAVSITGDIDIRVKVALDDWTPAAERALVARFEGASQRSYYFSVNTSGNLRFITTSGGTDATAIDTNRGPTGFTDSTTHWVRVTRDVDNGAAGNDTKFYTSDDGETWVQLGATSTAAGTTSIFDGTAALEVGSRLAGTTNPMAGNVYYAEIRNGIDGPVVAKFDANTVPQTGTRTPSSWTSETGEVWTINGSAWAWGGEWGTPHAGNIRPMRRVRIRETFNGVTYPVFDGFIDRWELDYPGVGRDATATVTATDAFKIFARTELGRSVYDNEVLEDGPAIYWRLDELDADPSTEALNAGTLGEVGNGTYFGPVAKRGEETLVFLDPGTSIRTVDQGGFVSVPGMGVSIAEADFDLNSFGSWAVEFWVKPEDTPIGVDVWASGYSGANVAMQIQSESNTPEYWTFLLVNTTPTVFGVTGNAAGQDPNARYHIVAKYGPNRAMAIYVNGVRFTTTAATRTAPPVTGTLRDSTLVRFLDSDIVQSPATLADAFAIYTAAEAVDPLPDARITAHHAAGNTPWQGDLPGARLDRVLDLAEWPSTARELDDGATTLQSAAITSQTVLEHSQKVGETEFGLLFINREGNVRFVSRANVFARAVGPEVYGDSAGDVGYREFIPDDGDQVIRNRATISRLNGVAKTDFDQTSIDEFGRFDYALEGLLHQSDAYSLTYAGFIVDEYKDPRRRITSLALGPAGDGEEGVVYPAMLGRELGEVITVHSNPLGGGAEFTQVCAIEGIEMSGTPEVLTATFILSPDYSQTF